MMTKLCELLIALAVMTFLSGSYLGEVASRGSTWQKIMGKVKRSHNHMAAVSYGCLFLEGISVPVESMEGAIGGVRGLVVEFKNLATLIRAVDYLESLGSVSRNRSKVLRSLRKEGENARFTTFVAIGMQCMKSVCGNSDLMFAKAVGEYVSFIAHLSHAIRDHNPELLEDYLVAMNDI